MNARAMITLGVILKDQLPVGTHVVFDSFLRSQIWKIPLRELVIKRRKPCLEAVGASPGRRACEVYKNEAFPNACGRTVQGKIRSIEPRNFIHVRRTGQPAIQSVGPRVV